MALCRASESLSTPDRLRLWDVAAWSATHLATTSRAFSESERTSHEFFQRREEEQRVRHVQFRQEASRGHVRWPGRIAERGASDRKYRDRALPSISPSARVVRCYCARDRDCFCGVVGAQG